MEQSRRVSNILAAYGRLPRDERQECILALMARAYNEMRLEIVASNEDEPATIRNAKAGPWTEDVVKFQDGRVFARRYTKCGREKCFCSEPGGKRHGPYWYETIVMPNGRKKPKYIGRTLPHDHANFSDLSPEEVAALPAEAKRRQYATKPGPKPRGADLPEPDAADLLPLEDDDGLDDGFVDVTGLANYEPSREMLESDFDTIRAQAALEKAAFLRDEPELAAALLHPPRLSSITMPPPTAAETQALTDGL